MRRGALLTAVVTAALLAAACGSNAAGPSAGGDRTESSVARPAADADTPAAASEASAVGATVRAAGPATAPKPAPATSTTMPVTGRGYTAREVFVGIGTQNNHSALGTAMGLALAFGDTKTQAEAVIADLNARGGVLGRKVVGVYHDDDATEQNLDARGQAACTTWTEDNRVAAVANIVAAVALDTTLACLKQRDTPMFTSVLASYDDVVYKKYAPYLVTPGIASYTRVVPVWMARLAAQNYFAPDAVYGILRLDAPSSKRVAQQLRAELRQRGLAVKTEVATAFELQQAAADNAAAVTRFAADGVTHLFVVDPDGTVFFPQAAESQGYRPRYALTSFATLNTAQATVPAAQFARAAGVGFLPPSDVDGAHDPGDVSPNEARCRDIMLGAGVDTSNRQAEWATQGMCDTIWLFEKAAALGGGFSTAALRRGLAKLGEGFHSALTFRSVFREDRFDGAGAVRDITWDVACRCFLYPRRDLHPL